MQVCCQTICLERPQSVCVGVLVIRILVFTVFCIFVLCFLYCFVYVYLFLFVCSVPV